MSTFGSKSSRITFAKESYVSLIKCSRLISNSRQTWLSSVNLLILVAGTEFMRIPSLLTKKTKIKTKLEISFFDEFHNYLIKIDEFILA